MTTQRDGGTVADDGEVVDETGSAEDPTLWERWERARGNERTVIGVTIVTVTLFPFVFARLLPAIFRGIPFVGPILGGGYQGLATLILIWAIFAIGFDLLLGYTGLLSFGHAAFWGVGAYAAGVFSAEVAGEPFLMVVAGTVAAVVAALLLGFLSLRRGGIYFAILTLAFAQMLFYLAAAPLAFVTNGEDGFTDVHLGELFGVIELTDTMPSVFGLLFGTWLYLFVAVLTVIAVAVAYRVLNSPYGLVFRAIRENELRAEFVGLHVWRYKLMSFVLSGAFAGLAGALFAIDGRYVPLESLYWTTSGEIVIMTVLGGVGSLFGPMLGAGLYLYIENVISGIPGFGPFWQLTLGAVFVLVVWFAPKGIWGLIDDARTLVSEHRGGDR